MKKVAIVQSNYIPWKGYFDLIASVDEFILFDDMQFTKRNWRNRNLIKTPQGIKWITIPVLVKGRYFQKIRETKIEGTGWRIKHWRHLESCYRPASFFDEISSWLKPLYNEANHIFISEVNRYFIEAICNYLNIKTKISNSWDYELKEGKTERLANLCLQAGGSEYLSGPSAKDYIDENIFQEQGIKLKWMDYSNYPEYPQLWGEFSHGVSILDLLFNCGKDSQKYMRHFS